MTLVQLRCITELLWNKRKLYEMFLVVSFPLGLLHNSIAICSFSAGRHWSSATIAFCPLPCSVLLLENLSFCSSFILELKIWYLVCSSTRVLTHLPRAALALPSVGCAVSGFVCGGQDALFPALAVSWSYVLQSVSPIASWLLFLCRSNLFISCITRQGN